MVSIARDRGKDFIMAEQKQSQADGASQTQSQQQGVVSQPQADGGQVQGEGNYEAAKEYDDAQRRFVESGKVDQAARDAEPRTDAERRDMERAEQEGRSRAKEEDPQLQRGAGGVPPQDTQSH
jgi:hypothetical protein